VNHIQWRCRGWGDRGAGLGIQGRGYPKSKITKI